MTALAARLKALAKALGQGKELPPEVLERLEACLDEIDKVLPPARRGRPKQRDLVPDMLLSYVDTRMAQGETAREALQRLIRQRLIVRGDLHTLQNKLGKARKAPK